MYAWAKAGINPSGDWYIVTRAFMTETLKRADTEKGYFMTDSSTWIAERTNLPNLKILFRGDKFFYQHIPYPLPAERRYCGGRYRCEIH
jgi:tungstate transport system substrate-binding protein